MRRLADRPGRTAVAGGPSTVPPKRRRDIIELDAAIREVLSLESSSGLEALLHAARLAFSQGGYHTAEGLADELALRARAAPEPARLAALDVIRDIYLACGRVSEARGLGTELRPRASELDLAEAMLDESELRLLASRERFRLPTGRLNTYLLSWLVARGELGSEPLASIICERSHEPVLNPEIELLLSDVHRSTSGRPHLASLNRFLSACGLKGATHSHTASLAGIEFQSGRKVRSGPLVSVLLSAHNAGKTAGYALESMLQQNYTNCEFLVCDDASTDDTLSLLMEAARDPRVKVYRSIGNQGPYNVRNQLLTQARGELVTFHDADDVAAPERIALQVRALRERRAAGVIASMVRVRTSGAFVFFRDQRATRMSVVSLLARAEALRHAGPYRSARFGADLELVERLQTGPDTALLRLKVPLSLALWGSGSLTRISGAEALETGFRSPARRLYGELTFRQRLLGKDMVPDSDIDDQLAQIGNFVAASKLERVG